MSFLPQVTLGVFNTAREAAQQYDRALIVEKGIRNKRDIPLTNFSLLDYLSDIWQFKDILTVRRVHLHLCMKFCNTKCNLEAK